jgi:hypothetical protein
MSDESCLVAMAPDPSLREKVRELRGRAVELFATAAELVDELRHCHRTSDTPEADAQSREVLDRIDGLIKSLVSIRQQETLLWYFALAYKERLGRCYVVQDNGKSFVMERDGDDRPCEVEPLK